MTPRRPRSGLGNRLVGVATLLVGFIGSGLFSRGMVQNPPTSAPLVAPRRRQPRALLRLEVVLPDGAIAHPALRGELDTPVFAQLDVAGRRLAFSTTTADEGRLHIAAHAPAAGPHCPAFAAHAEEDAPAVWRLPVAAGFATLRVNLSREYALS
ncbi:MAG: hypothetical protein EPN72_09015 [Nevskiaceae bacterium]|nr:MAG: hypothetical protein EPN63_08355 [Nevskiaceae bacterium]TBR72580.1 MAG: hypothetical protein EPN72_09015 [Nevskiaceae bacterium]